MRIMKRLRSINYYERWMFVTLAIAIFLRFMLIYFNWPSTNSDEGNMGLVGLHVAYQGDHPTFFYGLPYMGPLEGYAAAPFFRLFGPSLFTLRIPLVLFFAGTLLSLYYLMRLLYNNKKFALAAVILIALGSPDLFFLQLRASGEYPEVLMFAAFISFLAAWLALSSHRIDQNDREPTRGERRKRIVIYGLLGLAVGLALWVDFLILPFVATAGLLLWLFCRQELLRWPGCSLLLGIIIGAFPLIYYNFTAPLSQNSFFVLLWIHHMGATDMVAQHLTWVNQLSGTMMMALPWATGFNPRCPVTAIPPSGSPTLVTLPCVLAQGGWGFGYLVLWFIASFFAIRAVWRYRQQMLAGFTRDTPFEERQETIRQSGRLMLLVSVGLTLILYAIAPASAVTPITSFRYLTCMLLAVPALLWPVWQGLLKVLKATARVDRTIHEHHKAPRPMFGGTLAVALGLLVAFTFISGTVNTFMEVPAAQVAYQQQQKLIQDLEHVGATRVYSDYWTCNWLTFQSQEKVICSVLDDQLKPGFDRYLPYRSIVRAAPRPAYIFSLNSASGQKQAQALQLRIASSSTHYRQYTFDGYVVYQPM